MIQIYTSKASVNEQNFLTNCFVLLVILIWLVKNGLVGDSYDGDLRVPVVSGFVWWLWLSNVYQY